MDHDVDILYLMKKEMLRRKYSIMTVKAYVFWVKKFLSRCHTPVRRITTHDVREYLDWLCEREKSASTLNINLQALKFALEEILNKRFFVKLPYSKIPNRMPEVLTKEEVLKLFGAVSNKKHSLMLRLMYSAGLRVGELVRLKVKDLEFSRNHGWVRQGKGAKDRYFVLSPRLKKEIVDFIQENHLDYSGCIFVGNKRIYMSIRSVQEIVKKAAKAAGIMKRVHPHTLRHSFATHLIEDGYDLVTVQAVMGHGSPETTQVYVHMANPNIIRVKSPYDSLIDTTNNEDAENE